MEAGKVLLGTLAGVAIGAIVGVLLAPDKGSETRRRISEKGTGYADGLRNKVEGLKDKYNTLVDDVTSKLESFNGDGAESRGNGQARTASAGAGATGGSMGGSTGSDGTNR